MAKLRDWITGPRLVLLLSLLAALLLWVLSSFSTPPHIAFLAGPKESTFYVDAMRYKELLQVHGVTVEVIETNGTIENLQRLVEAEVPTAAFGDAIQGIKDKEEDKLEEEAEPGEEEAESQLAAISSLGAIYLQPLWIFTSADTDVKDLHGLGGKRIGSGWEGSSARLLAALLVDNAGLNEDTALNSINEKDEDVVAADALRALRDGRLAALLVMGQPDAPLIDALLRAPDVTALPITRAEAYSIHFPFLKAVRLPQGGYDLRANIPPEDLQMLAAGSELLVSEMFPPPLADLLLEAATEVHGGRSLFSHKHEFPNPDMVSIPLNLSAAHFYKEGPPVLRKVLPFRWATWIDRFWMILVGFGSAIIAVASVLPKVVEVFFNRKLENAYRTIEAIEKSLDSGLDRDAALAELDELDRTSAEFKIPMRPLIGPWMEMRQNMHDLRERVNS